MVPAVQCSSGTELAHFPCRYTPIYDPNPGGNRRIRREERIAGGMGRGRGEWLHKKVPGPGKGGTHHVYRSWDRPYHNQHEGPDPPNIELGRTVYYWRLRGGWFMMKLGCRGRSFCHRRAWGEVFATYPENGRLDRLLSPRTQTIDRISSAQLVFALYIAMLPPGSFPMPSCSRAG